MIQTNNVRPDNVRPVTKLRDVKKCTGSIMCELHERHVANMKEDAEVKVATVTLAWEGALEELREACQHVARREQEILDLRKLVDRHKHRFQMAMGVTGLVIGWAWYQVVGGR